MRSSTMVSSTENLILLPASEVRKCILQTIVLSRTKPGVHQQRCYFWTIAEPMVAYYASTTDFCNGSPPLGQFLVSEIIAIRRTDQHYRFSKHCFSIKTYTDEYYVFSYVESDVQVFLMNLNFIKCRYMERLYHDSQARLSGHPGAASGSGRFSDHYKIKDHVGHGGHSFVKSAIHRTTGEIVVAKFLSKGKVSRWAPGGIPYEIDVLLQLRHDNLSCVREYFEGPHYFIMINPYDGESCDLFELIEEVMRLSETDSRKIFVQLISALEHLQQAGFVHGDLKDENVVVNRKSLHVTLIDFGSCAPLHQAKALYQGSAKCASPEILRGDAYDPLAQESWSLGIILFTMLLGEDPLVSGGGVLLDPIDRIQREGLSVSADAKALLQMMLHQAPEDRATLQQIANHPWVTEFAS